MSIDKKKALEILFKSARDYKENLGEKDLLFICIDKYKKINFLETRFSLSNFQHLTGIRTNKKKINANHFFNLCLDKRLKFNDFEFTSIGTTELKLQALPNIFSKDISGKMVGELSSLHFKLKTERLVGNVYSSIGFVKDLKSNLYVPNTLLVGNIKDFVNTTAQVIETYRKNSNDTFYNEQVYRTNSKTVDWGKVKQNEIYKNIPIIRKPIEKEEIIKTQPKRPKIVFHRPESKSNGRER